MTVFSIPTSAHLNNGQLVTSRHDVEAAVTSALSQKYNRDVAEFHIRWLFS